MAEKKTKEIGIRKVLGATVQSITALLTKNFLKLVMIASLVATPLAWWFMNFYLQQFSYRTTASWWIPVTTCAVALLISFCTISFQTIRAAIANPVKSLRTE